MHPFGVQTFFSQQKWVEGHVVDAEVEEALPRHPALPAAAGVVGHQLLWRREAEVQLKLQKGVSELFWILLLGGLTPPNLLCDEALHRTSPVLITWSLHFERFLIQTRAWFKPWLFLWRSWQHPLCSQKQTETGAGCGPASPSACSPPLWWLLLSKAAEKRVKCFCVVTTDRKW